MPHNTEQLSPCVTLLRVCSRAWKCNFWVHVPQLLKPMHHTSSPQEKPPQWEARAPQLERSPHSQLEKAHTQEQRPNIAENKKLKLLTRRKEWQGLFDWLFGLKFPISGDKNFFLPQDTRTASFMRFIPCFQEGRQEGSTCPSCISSFSSNFNSK